MKIVSFALPGDGSAIRTGLPGIATSNGPSGMVALIQPSGSFLSPAPGPERDEEGSGSTLVDGGAVDRLHPHAPPRMSRAKTISISCRFSATPPLAESDDCSRTGIGEY